MNWDDERLFLLGDQYFADLERAINTAKISIDVEMYLFSLDAIGERFLDLLLAASSRGVGVRLIVDGVGSLGFIGEISQRLKNSKIAFKVYHPLPVAQWLNKIQQFGQHQSFWSLVQKINRRTHRKLIIVDNESAYVGSRNLIKVHSEAQMGQDAWSDISAVVRGVGLPDLQLAFDRSWRGRGVFRRKYPKPKKPQQHAPELVRLNITRRIRRWHNRNLLLRLATASKRIWIATGYFVPTKSLQRTLAEAAKNRVDVRILVPSKSDVFFYPFVGAAFQFELMRAGAQIIEYLPAVLHSKAMIIDDYAIIGSSNINHRSILHDLEVDVVLSGAEVMSQLERRMLDDFSKSRALDAYKSNYTLWQRIIGRVALLFIRYI